jgi:ubiquinone/menaquinone biosynthesis C-methylase UbiE
MDWDSSVVLDIGCGPGTADAVYGSKADHVVALDVKKEFLEDKKADAIVLPVLGDATSLPFADGSIQTVVMSEVLEHIEDDRRAVDEIARVLAPQGHLIVTVPNAGWFAFLDPSHFIIAKAGLRIVGHPGQDLHRHYSRETLQDLVSPRFDVLKVSTTGGIATAVSILLVQLSKVIGSPRMMDFFNKVGGIDSELDYGQASVGLAVLMKKRG